MTRRDLAVTSFWSERPLVRCFTARTGLVSFTLRELIAFAEALSEAEFETLRGGGSQPPPQADAPTRRPIQEARRPGQSVALLAQGDQP